ncbi:MAG: hypothetical protein B9S38_05505 [Verrucomicrobiia bacterium Tous-C4TDCM]|nr:MAG: hypothetical protein B9S38_05505 [Verrucomicrobiae bacterium Tous-C4TDCM]
MGTDTGKERTILTGEPRGRNGPGRRKHRAARARWSAIKGRSDQRRLVQVEHRPVRRDQVQRLEPHQKRIGHRKPAASDRVHGQLKRNAAGVMIVMFAQRTIVWRLIMIRQLVIVPMAIARRPVAGGMMVIMLVRMGELDDTH